MWYSLLHLRLGPGGVGSSEWSYTAHIDVAPGQQSNAQDHLQYTASACAPPGCQILHHCSVCALVTTARPRIRRRKLGAIQYNNFVNAKIRYFARTFTWLCSNSFHIIQLNRSWSCRLPAWVVINICTWFQWDSSLPLAMCYCTLTPLRNQWRKRTNIKFKKQTNYFAGYMGEKAKGIFIQGAQSWSFSYGEIDFYANISLLIAGPSFLWWSRMEKSACN